MALFPRHDVKYCGNDEEGTEAHSVNPCRYLLPAVVRQPVQEGTAHDGWNDEELRERQREVNLPAFTERRPLLKIRSFTRDLFFFFFLVKESLFRKSQR